MPSTRTNRCKPVARAHSSLSRHTFCMCPPKHSTKKGRLIDDDGGGGGGTIASSALLLGEGGNGAGEPPPPPMVYAIRSGDHRIGNFILHKAEFCAGDIVLGNFDFSEASTRCLQVRSSLFGVGLFGLSFWFDSVGLASGVCGWRCRWRTRVCCVSCLQVRVAGARRRVIGPRICISCPRNGWFPLGLLLFLRTGYMNCLVVSTVLGSFIHQSVVRLSTRCLCSHARPSRTLPAHAFAAHAQIGSRSARAWRCAKKMRPSSAGAPRRRRPLGGHRHRGPGRAPATSALSTRARFVFLSLPHVRAGAPHVL